MRKPSKSTLDRKLLKAWGMIVRERASGKCEMCGRSGDNPHHIVGRRNYRLRYDLRNGLCLCSGCHTFKKTSAHQDPVAMYEYMVDYRSDDWDYLVTVRNEIKKWTIPEMEELLAKYTKIIDKKKWSSVIT